jgi:hypothetical protein
LGIDHIDLRRVNILQCYSPGSGIAQTNETHIFRVIDFDNSQMTNQRVEGMIANYTPLVDILLSNLAANSVIEPWDFDCMNRERWKGMRINAIPLKFSADP